MHVGQLGQRLFEESDIAGKKRPQNKTGGELPARAQVADERAHLRRRRFRRERHRRLFAGLAGDALRVIGIEPSTGGDKIDQRRGDAGNHFEAGRRREIVPSQQRFANGGPFAKTLENAIDRELGNLSIAILCQYQTSLGRADFGQGSRSRALEARTARDGYLDVFIPSGDRIDQIGIDKERRKRQHRSGDLRLIRGKRQHYRRRRARARRQHIGKCPAHQRRRVVEQYQHGAFGRCGVVRRKIRIKIRAGERSGRLGPFAGGRSADPIEEMADDHGFARAA